MIERVICLIAFYVFLGYVVVNSKHDTLDAGLFAVVSLLIWFCSIALNNVTRQEITISKKVGADER